MHSLIIMIIIIIAVVIGFHSGDYNVTEGMGMFTDIIVDLLIGGLGQDVVVTVSTQAGTAKGKFIIKYMQLYRALY